jgi:hypothetical protein
MKRVVLALLLVSAPAYAADRQLAEAFHAAFGKEGSVVLKKQGQLKENITYTPGELVNTSFGTVLISPGEVADATHVNSGKLAIVYLRPSAKGFDVVQKFVPAAEAGSFGKIVDWSVSRSFGDLPIVSVNGAGNWQGHSCSTTTLLELTPTGPRHLATLPMTYDDSVAVGTNGKYTQINGRIDNIQPNKAFDVVYFGSKEFTEHYVRKDNVYVLANGAASRVQRC